MAHEKDRPASDRIFVEPGGLTARERQRHLKGTPTSTIPVVTQQQQQPQPPLRDATAGESEN